MATTILEAFRGLTHRRGLHLREHEFSLEESIQGLRDFLSADSSTIKTALDLFPRTNTTARYLSRVIDHVGKPNPRYPAIVEFETEDKNFVVKKTPLNVEIWKHKDTGELDYIVYAPLLRHFSSLVNDIFLGRSVFFAQSPAFGQEYPDNFISPAEPELTHNEAIQQKYFSILQRAIGDFLTTVEA